MYPREEASLPSTDLISSSVRQQPADWSRPSYNYLQAIRDPFSSAGRTSSVLMHQHPKPLSGPRPEIGPGGKRGQDNANPNEVEHVLVRHGYESFISSDGTAVRGPSPACTILIRRVLLNRHHFKLSPRV